MESVNLSESSKKQVSVTPYANYVPYVNAYSYTSRAKDDMKKKKEEKSREYTVFLNRRQS